MRGALQPDDEPDRALVAIPAGIAFIMTGLDKFEDHWWYDNLAHVCGGISVGTVVHHYTDDVEASLWTFLGIATLWEAFEYLVGERPWDGSMTFDHAMEDTLLDTVMGLVGVWLAARLNHRD